MCTNVGACRPHEEGRQAQASPHWSGLGGMDTLSLTLPHQGIEPKVFGLEFRRTNHCAGVEAEEE